MSTQITPNVGEQAILSNMNQGSWKVELVVNDFTVSEGLVEGDLTMPTDGSYAPITYASAAGTVATDGSNVTTLAWSEQSFDFSAAETVYGWAIYWDPAGGTSYSFISAGKFTSSISIPVDGGRINFTPKYSLD